MPRKKTISSKGIIHQTADTDEELFETEEDKVIATKAHDGVRSEADETLETEDDESPLISNTDQEPNLMLCDELSKQQERNIGDLIVGDSDCSFYKVSNAICTRHSAFILNNWTTLARALETSEYFIEIARDDMLLRRKNINDIVIDFLTRWRSLQSDNATLLELISILSPNGFEDMKVYTRALREEFNVPEENHWNEGENIEKHQRKRYAFLGFIITALIASSGIVTFLLLKPEGPKFCSTLPNLPSYFISRSVKPRPILDNSKLFRVSLGENVLVFHGADYQKIKSLFPTQNPQEIKYAIKYGLKSNYVTDLKEISEFETLCSIESKKSSVNWINFHENQFTWVRTCGNISLILNLASINASVISEDRFRGFIEFQNHTSPKKHWDNVFNNSLIIVGENGVGKSTLLASLGDKTKDQSPDVIVVFSDMLTFTLSVKKFLDRDTNLNSVIIKVVCGIKCLNINCQNIITDGMSSGSKKFLILLKGFDQIPKRFQELGISILQTLKQLNSTFTVVTSQSRLLTYLEEHLVTMTYQLEPFDEASQISLLVEFWNSSYNSPPNVSYLNEFASSIVYWLKDTFTQTEKTLAGVALETLLIAEAYIDDARNYADEKNIIPQSHKLTNFMSSNLSLFNLFTFIVNKKICKVLTDCEDEKAILYYHSYQALNTKFPNISAKSKNLFSNEIIEKIGLMENYDETGNLRFIHSSFVDYLVSWYLINCEHKELCTEVSNTIFEMDTNLINMNTSYRFHCLLRSISYSFREHLLLYFLDSAPKLNKDIVKYVNAHAINKTSLLLATVQHNFLAIFDLFKDYIEESNYELIYMQGVLYSLDQYALENTINTSNYNSSKKLSQTVSGSCSFVEKQNQFPISLLHLAIIRGDESIIVFLLNLEPVNAWGKFLLHFCASSMAARIDLLGYPINGIFYDQRNLKKNTLVDLFLNESAFLLEEDDEQHLSCPPLFSADTYDTIVYLVEKGANPSYNVPYFCELLNLIQLTLTSKQYDDTIAYLNTKEKLSSLLLDPSDSLATLYLAIRAYTLSPKTLEIFKIAGVNFTFSSQLIGSPLMAAIEGMKSLNFLELIIHYQTNWKNSSKFDMSALAYSALINNIDALDFFQKHSPGDVDNRDHSNKTALYYASGCGQRFNNTKIVAKLLKNNADPQKTFGNNHETPLLQAARLGPIKLVRILVKACKFKYKTDLLGNTALHYAVWYELTGKNSCAFVFPPPDQDTIVKFLINEANFDVNAKNSANHTALEVAIRNFTASPMLLLTSMKILIEGGAFVNRDNQYLCIRNAMRCPSPFKEDILDEKEYSIYVDTINAHNLSRRDIFGNTLLHVATQENCLNGVKYLVRNHFDVNLCDSAGHTALYYMKPGHSDKTALLIYEFLKKHGAHR